METRDPAHITIDEQLKAARRELGMRQNAYPKWVAASRMSQTKADHEIAAMAAIVATLERLAEQERLL